MYCDVGAGVVPRLVIATVRSPYLPGSEYASKPSREQSRRSAERVLRKSPTSRTRHRMYLTQRRATTNLEIFQPGANHNTNFHLGPFQLTISMVRLLPQCIAKCRRKRQHARMSRPPHRHGPRESPPAASKEGRGGRTGVCFRRPGTEGDPWGKGRKMQKSTKSNPQRATKISWSHLSARRTEGPTYPLHVAV
ncbi:hypothetical protein VTK56DRAFT_3127 [Thermocarpiscus australiensis]